MNMPTEASPDQSACGAARSGDSAEAAHRDLLEFLSTSDAPPPLAADALPQVERAALPDFTPSDFVRRSDGMPPVSPDRRSAPDESEGALPELHPHSAPAHRDDDTEACERAARSAAQAVDEATTKNLRRIESTKSRLQQKAQGRRVPRTPPLASARGVPIVPERAASLPAFNAVIDRSSLHRTVHGTTMQSSPPLPIWLREHEAPIRLPPPRRGGGLWRRLVKFFWACTVAAPIAYVFAITTSPLHKHLFDAAGLTSAISSLLPAPHAQHAQLQGRDLIAIANAAPELSAIPADTGASKQAIAVIPPGVPVVASLAAELGPAGAVSTPAGEVVAPSDADRASAPEAAQAPPEQTVIAATEVGEPPPIAAAAQADDSAGLAKQAAQQDVSALVGQGKAFFEAGDLIAARILFKRAVNGGDAVAAIAMGATYDPAVLAQRGLRGVAADPDKARAWYERAKDMGSSEGPRRLEMQANR